MSFCLEEKSGKEKCEELVSFMNNTIYPYNKVRSLICAIYIRDNIGIPKIINTLFRDLYGFDIVCNEIEFNESIKFEELIDTKNKFIFIYLKVQDNKHVNMIFINTHSKEYYYYEPHFGSEEQIKKYGMRPIYNYISFIKKLFAQNNYKCLDMPKTLLAQEALPFCYMYCLHFFIHKVINYNNDDMLYTKTCDDLYIMRFIRDMLKLCHINNLHKLFLPEHSKTFDVI
jgi:hypothetical protein